MAAIAVLGAGGFIGRHVVDELARRGHAVHALALQPRPPSLPTSVGWEQLDLDVAVPEAAHGIAIHLAEPAVASGIDHATRCVARMQRVLALPFSQIIYGSSGTVYGDSAATPRTEICPTHAQGAYVEAKLATEAVAAQDPRCTIVRLANVYGPGMSPANVVSEILAQLGSSGPLRVRDLGPVRDYIHAADVARAVANLTERAAGGRLYNIGSGHGASVEQIARMLCAASGQPGRALEATQPAGRASYLVLDPSRARAQLGWQPMIPLESGLTTLIQDRKS